MSNIVEFEDVTFGYENDSKLLSSLNLQIKKGKYTVLLGHNGSGKSTIAKLSIGLIEPFNGVIKVDGIKVSEETLYDIRNKVALVFQNPDNQFIGSTVEDDIAFGLENRKVDPSKMEDIIKYYASKVGMESFLKEEPSNLSGGQKQRVAIAGALALNPKLLILDEATSMLDPKGKKEINELIKDVKSKNDEMSILAITHHIDEALLADEVIILNDGKISAIGSPKDILFDKKILEDNHLSMPFVIKVQDKLKENGIIIDKCYSIDEIVEKL